MHTMITGQTMSGKSTLARQIIPLYTRIGVPVLVYSPVEPAAVWPEGCEVYSNIAEFMRRIIALSEEDDFEGGVLVIDEADTILAQRFPENWWLLTRSRHYGFRAFVLTQRPQMVAPTVRGQCAEVFVFYVSASDAKMLADDFATPGLKYATELKQGEFIRSHWQNGEKVATKGRAFVVGG